MNTPFSLDFLMEKDLFYSNTYSSKKDSRFLYYYTDLPEFKEIIEGGFVKAINASCLNDINEISFAIEMIYKTVKEVIAENNTNNYDDIFIDILRDSINFLDKSLREYIYIIRFFSSNPNNSLELWKTQTQGISIKFDIDMLRKSMFKSDLDKEVIIFRAHSIIYGEKNSVKDIKYLIDMIYRKNFTIKCQEEKLLKLLIHSFKYISSLYKHECFKHENEVRFVLDTHLVMDMSKVIKYKATDNILIPYIKCLYGKDIEDFPIKVVTIGPSDCDEFIKQGVEYFLKFKGYDNVDVNLSGLPFRYLL